MPTQVQFRRGTSAQNDNFLGAAGEISIDTTKNTIRVHDGVTSGGFALSSPQDLTTANVAEVTNLYFTTTRANTAIDDRVTKTFVDNLGIDATTLDGIDSTAFALDTDLTTANVAEVTNLYFTNARSRLSISASGSINYDNTTGVISFTQGNTDTISEGSTNLYFTNARSIASLVGQSITMGEATITGNLFVLGNVVEFATETLTIEDKNIILANGAVSAAVADGAGITIDGAQANLVYLSAGDMFQFNKNLDVVGNITATGTITSPFYYSESDMTLKEEINPIQNALKKVTELIGVDFIWKSTKQKAIGVIAQNVERVVPEIVSRSTTGVKTVQYDSIIPLLIEAIKDQQKQIEELRNKIK